MVYFSAQGMCQWQNESCILAITETLEFELNKGIGLKASAFSPKKRCN